MSSWILGTWNALGADKEGEEARGLMGWPMWVSERHGRGELERRSLVGGMGSAGEKRGEDIRKQAWRESVE